MDKSMMQQILETIAEQKADAEFGMNLLIDVVARVGKEPRPMQILRQYQRLLTMFLQHAQQAEESESNPYAILSRLPLKFAMPDEDD